MNCTVPYSGPWPPCAAHSGLYAPHFVPDNDTSLPMKLQDYFDQMATDGSWSSSLYKGTPTYKTYNFIARRAAVISLLENEGDFGRILDVGCGKAHLIYELKKLVQRSFNCKSNSKF